MAGGDEISERTPGRWPKSHQAGHGAVGLGTSLVPVLPNISQVLPKYLLNGLSGEYVI